MTDIDTIADVIAASVRTAMAPIVARCEAVEAQVAALAAAPAEPDVDPAVVGSMLAEMLKASMGDALTPVRTQKTIVRDANGQIVALREEPVA